jgi:hypothetical protein
MAVLMEPCIGELQVDTDSSKGYEFLFESEELFEVLDLLHEPVLIGQAEITDLEIDDPILFQRVERKVRNKLNRKGRYHAA